MKFRLNDKVIVTQFDRSFTEGDYKNRVATIIAVDRIKLINSQWDYEIKFNDGRTYVYGENEMKLAPMYQQLYFDFV